MAASEAFFCGTGWEITPVIDIDGSPVGDGTPGELTRKLQRTYFDITKGVVEDKRGWLTDV